MTKMIVTLTITPPYGNLHGGTRLHLLLNNPDQANLHFEIMTQEVKGVAPDSLSPVLMMRARIMVMTILNHHLLLPQLCEK
jgi:hypothetical protein